MARLEKSIDIAVPMRVAYDQWSRFEELPSFMESVKEVVRLGPSDYRWRVRIGGREVTWTATILHQDPDHRIVWQSTSGDPNTGSVSFLPLGPKGTRIIVILDWEPGSLAGKLWSALGLVGARVERELDRFKRFVEGRADARSLGRSRGGRVA